MIFQIMLMVNFGLLLVIVLKAKEENAAYRRGKAEGILIGRQHGVFVAHLRAKSACHYLKDAIVKKQFHSGNPKDQMIVIQTLTTGEELLRGGHHE